MSGFAARGSDDPLDWRARSFGDSAMWRFLILGRRNTRIRLVLPTINAFVVVRILNNPEHDERDQDQHLEPKQTPLHCTPAYLFCEKSVWCLTHKSTGHSCQYDCERIKQFGLCKTCEATGVVNMHDIIIAYIHKATVIPSNVDAIRGNFLLHKSTMIRSVGPTLVNDMLWSDGYGCVLQKLYRLSC